MLNVGVIIPRVRYIEQLYDLIKDSRLEDR